MDEFIHFQSNRLVRAGQYIAIDRNICSINTAETAV